MEIRSHLIKEMKKPWEKKNKFGDKKPWEKKEYSKYNNND